MPQYQHIIIINPKESIMPFEVEIIKALQQGATRDFIYVQRVFSYTASVFVVLVLALVFYFAYNKRFALSFLITQGITYGIGFILKRIIARPRPYTVIGNGILCFMEESGYSMPSGHSLCAMVITCFVIWLVCRSVKDKWAKGFSIAGMLVYLFAMGYNRMFLGVHYLTDILLGWAISLLAFLAVYFLEPKVYAFIQKKIEQKHAKEEESANNTSTTPNSEVKSSSKSVK